jgi:hypothetical protein
MTTQRIFSSFNATWFRALLQPAPLLGMAMIAVLWAGLAYLLADHHGTLADPEIRAPIFILIVIVLTLLELITMMASVRRQMSLEQTNLRFDTALEN